MLLLGALQACAGDRVRDTGPTDATVVTDPPPPPPEPEACAVAGAICTIAGNGQRGYIGDGPATSVMLYFPTAIAFDPEGLPLVVDYNNYRVRRIRDGQLEPAIGNGVHAYALAGAPALDCPLENPIDLAVAPDGSMYIVEQHASRVLKLDTDGIVRDFAGTMGVAGDEGDGGPALTALFSDYVTGLAVAPDGSVYIADPVHHDVRVVLPEGSIATVAGLDAGYVDGTFAEARFNSPQHIRWHGDAIYVADQYNHAIRRIDLLTSTVTTVAGTGVVGFSGDGGPATAAMLNAPNGLDIAPDGTLYIADSSNHRIRRVGLDGIITTIAGRGEAALDGDGGPATLAAMNWPTHVTVGPDGLLYVADTLNSVVRTVVPP